MRKLSSSSNNIITLVRLGFLPPDISYEDLKKTLYYIFWDHFRLVCALGEIKSLTPPDIFCNKLKTKCNFEMCPVVKSVLRDYERKRSKVF